MYMDDTRSPYFPEVCPERKGSLEGSCYCSMDGFDIVMVISIILFARLGVRLVSRYMQMRKDGENGKSNDPY